MKKDQLIHSWYGIVVFFLVAFLEGISTQAAVIPQTEVDNGLRWGDDLWGTPAAVPTAGNTYYSNLKSGTSGTAGRLDASGTFPGDALYLGYDYDTATGTFTRSTDAFVSLIAKTAQNPAVVDKLYLGNVRISAGTNVGATENFQGLNENSFIQIGDQSGDVAYLTVSGGDRGFNIASNIQGVGTVAFRGFNSGAVASNFTITLTGNNEKFSGVWDLSGKTINTSTSSGTADVITEINSADFKTSLYVGNYGATGDLGTGKVLLGAGQSVLFRRGADLTVGNEFTNNTDATGGDIHISGNAGTQITLAGDSPEYNGTIHVSYGDLLVQADFGKADVVVGDRDAAKLLIGENNGALDSLTMKTTAGTIEVLLSNDMNPLSVGELTLGKENQITFNTDNFDLGVVSFLEFDTAKMADGSAVDWASVLDTASLSAAGLAYTIANNSVMVGDTASLPEPTAWILMLLGCLFLRRR